LRFGAGVDDGWLAARLLCPAMPRALAHMSAFTGVTGVPPGSVVSLSGAEPAGVSVRRWWTPPEPPALGLDEGARLLGDALVSAVSAVAAPTRGAGSVSVSIDDLPSLALAGVCGRALPDVGLLFLTMPAVPVINLGLYARIAAGRQPYAEQRRIMPADRPSYGSGLDRLPPLDEPPRFALAIGALSDVVRRAGEWGAGGHLSGLGGSEALLAPRSYLRRVQLDPARREAHLRGWALAHGMPPAALREVLATEPGSYPDWLARLSGSLREPPRPLATGWEQESRLPAWATRSAADAVRDLLGGATGNAESLAHCPGQHTAVAELQAAARTGALANDVTTALGVPVGFPYLDLRVVEACLATIPEERTDPHRPLPLLTAALPHPHRPELHRRRRGPTADALAGLRDNRRELTALVDGGLLAARGLIDVGTLRPVLDEPWCHESQVAALITTLAVEAWLRTV
ncbi:MAG TPA: asparagine synthase-related protein, partial [Mycobacteriales bacterium]|nr:asparagine synthase-related protein [Mycobacteriales bacterium]